MSAAEDDTELRDLLIQNLENSGALGKIKAELRAAVFLAMEEQESGQKKAPMIHPDLKTCLSSRDGRLVVGLIADFLQVFNLDFSLSVFQPEINMLTGLDSREQVCRDLGLSDSEQKKNSPLLLELVRRHRESLGGPEQETKNGAREVSDVMSPSEVLKKESSLTGGASKPKTSPSSSPPSPGMRKDIPDLNLEDHDDHEDGDSFFDDPLPKPQKTYGCQRGSPDKKKGGGGGSVSEPTHSRNDEDLDYDDDFNSHRSEFSRTDQSIGEEIEEGSMEAPEQSDRWDISTQDFTGSQTSHADDYMEDVS